MIKEKIQQDITVRKISCLTHFTDISNLDSIMKHGLLSIKSLNNDNINYLNNDDLRLEGRQNSISLSIEFPNYQMFYKYRECQIIKKNMIVLLIDPLLILEKDCLFFYKNAASSEFCCYNDEKLRDIESWKAMFKSSVDNRQREQLHIPNNYTTSPQAEILCLEKIEPRYIKEIVYSTQDDYNRFGKLHPNIFNYQEQSFIYPNAFYHSPRNDYAHWSN